MIKAYQDGAIWIATDGHHEATGWSEGSAIARLNEKLRRSK